MSHTTTWTDKGVYWKLSGELTSLELFEFQQEWIEADTIETLRYFLVDCLDVTTYTEDPDDAGLTATQSDSVAIYNQRLMGAWVFKTPILKNLIENYIESAKASGVPWQFAVFDNLEDAWNWIDTQL